MNQEQLKKIAEKSFAIQNEHGEKVFFVDSSLLKTSISNVKFEPIWIDDKLTVMASADWRWYI